MSYPEALAEAVVSARAKAHIHTAKELAEQMGISQRLVNEIENARRDSYSKTTLARLDVALEWPSGFAEHLLRTGEHLERDEAPEPSRTTIAPWRAVQSNGQQYLQVTASYDPHLTSDEDLARIALNARHYMRKELDEASGTGQDSKPAPVTPFPTRTERTVDLNSVAAAPARSEYHAHGDEDELSQLDP